MQFKVPQFIDIEDKVFGPLTFKQFAYLAGSAGLAYLAMKFLPTFIALFVVPAFAGLGLALAFMRYNDKPFIFTLEAFIRYYARDRLYLWHKQTQKEAPLIKREVETERATMTDSKLKTLSWSLDVIDPKQL
ncbi:PrgI family protein [Patescibacteria group bacterium]|nr:PrgI family protein [Patescibacteria group bacterium]